MKVVAPSWNFDTLRSHGYLLVLFAPPPAGVRYPYIVGDCLLAVSHPVYGYELGLVAPFHRICMKLLSFTQHPNIVSPLGLVEYATRPLAFTHLLSVITILPPTLLVV